MFNYNLKSAMHTVDLSIERQCAGSVGYWTGAEFSTVVNSNAQDPIKLASFYKDSENT